MGSVVVLREDGAALLQHRDNTPGLSRPGVWVTPGGHCDEGETIEACARREFREETAYVCGELERLATFIDPDDPGCRCTMFWARYDGLQPVRCLEGQALEFVSFADAMAYRVPPFLIDLWRMALEASRTFPSAPAPSVVAAAEGQTL